ncbi:MAG: helix-turn-helix domain-containing protein [bacterium]
MGPNQATVRRASILAWVEANPGQGFRALSRGTCIPTGTLAHHLGILKRRGLVADRALGPRRLFYPTDAIVDDPAKAAMNLHPGLAALYAFVQANGPCMQNVVLAAFEAQGWPRSTTQQRLRRLVAVGGLQAVRGVRSLRYAVQAPAVAQLPLASRLQVVLA